MKTIKKWTSVFLAATLLLAISPIASAQTNTTLAESYSQATKIANDFMNVAGNGNLSADYARPLYDAADSIAGYYVAMSPTGYVIVDATERIVEFAPSHHIDLPSERIYYFGAGQYYTKTDTDYVHIFQLMFSLLK